MKKDKNKKADENRFHKEYGLFSNVKYIAKNMFSIEPKSLALFPPPKELIPTEMRLSPIDKTTICGRSFPNL